MELTVAEWRRWGADYLRRRATDALDGDSPLATADALLQNLVTATQTDYRRQFAAVLSAEAVQAYRERLERYRGGEPLAYICKETFFFGLPLAVGPGVLIPRPDTETLVLAGLSILKDFACRKNSLGKPAGKEPLLVLEPCTGSLAVSLALDLLYHEWRIESKQPTFFPDLSIWATDLSSEALSYAALNLDRCRRPDTQIKLFRGDLFTGLSPAVPAARPADRERDPVAGEAAGDGEGGSLPRGEAVLILANPPYIEENVLPELAPGVRLYEPRLALAGGADGLEFYRRLAVEAKDYLQPGGYIAVEHGYNQGESVAAVFAAAGDWSEGETLVDLAGRDRVYQACYRPHHAPSH